MVSLQIAPTGLIGVFLAVLIPISYDLRSACQAMFRMESDPEIPEAESIFVADEIMDRLQKRKIYQGGKRPLYRFLH